VDYLGVVIIVGVMGLGIVAAIGIPAYMDYVEAAKAAQTP
jgi:Tfp pilus assembly protein PilE